MVEVTAEGYASIQQRIRFSGNTNREMNMALRRNTGLFLTIQNQTEREPKNEMRIKIRDLSDSGLIFEGTVINGQKDFNDLYGGPFLIEAESPDGMTHQVQRASAGDEVLVQLKPFARILGQAKTRDGDSLTDCSYRYNMDLECTGKWSENSWNKLENGNPFEINNLREGCYRVELKRNSDGRIVSSPDLRLKDGDVRQLTLQMTEGGVLRGHVITAGDGLNVVQARVTLDEGLDKQVTSTDAEGYFVLDNLNNKPFSISIHITRENKDFHFENIIVKDNETHEQTFRIDLPTLDRDERINRNKNAALLRGEDGSGGDATPPWMRGDGPPPWEDETPPWGDNPPPWGDNPPPWGDNPPPWMDGDNPQPPWGDGPPPWGDNPPPWMDGGNSPLPEDNGQPFGEDENLGDGSKNVKHEGSK